MESWSATALWALLRENAQYLTAFAYVASSAAVTLHATLWKRDSPAVVAWIGVAWLSPFVGALGYYLFGINRIRRRAARLSVGQAWLPVRALELSAAETEQRARLLKSRRAGGLVRLSDRISNRRLLPGNRIRPLVNGDETYPAMLEAIAAADKSISLASYIFDNDPTGMEFVDSLAAAVARGVEVRVLIDAVGASYSRRSIFKPLRLAKVPTAAFLPTRLPRLPNTANLRNHRKLLVVDGETGFTGGTNIRHNHRLALAPRAPTRCLHFELAGPVIRHLQQTFALDWAFASGEQLEGERWFPGEERKGEVWARGISHGPDEDFEKLGELLLGALSLARASVQIVTPYFLPPPGLMRILGITALRGVRVDILIPEVNNVRLVQWATLGEISRLLEAGCNVYLVPPPFDHSKLLVIDERWSLIGSTNWDQRSLRLNFEFNVECFSAPLARRLAGMVEEKRRGARRLSARQLGSRSLLAKLRDGSARLLAPYL